MSLHDVGSKVVVVVVFVGAGGELRCRIVAVIPNTVITGMSLYIAVIPNTVITDMSLYIAVIPDNSFHWHVIVHCSHP